MKIGIALLGSAALCMVCASATAQGTTTNPPDRIVTNIDASQAAPPVSKYVFGMFI